MNCKYAIHTVVTVAFSLSMLVYSCSKKIPLTADDVGATNDGISAVIKANNQFALDLYSKFIQDEPGNIFFSPYSISLALAMTYEGARGKTAEEMESVLHLPEDESSRRPAFARIYNIVNKIDKKYELRTANALWVQKDYPLLGEYVNIIQRYYVGKTTNLDFVKETEKSRQVINDWVEEQAKNRIKDLIPQGLLSAYTRLVLTNAIYFKGEWLKQFDKENTKEEDFRVSPERIVKVQMMRLTDDVMFNYAETGELQILEMPYAGEELSMLILLPKEDYNLKSLEESLNQKKLSEWKTMLNKQEVRVYIPRFKFETKYFLADVLIKMGMPTAFSPNADFSGMDGTRNLFIDDVIHQGFIEVTEEGTEAAAATAVVMKLTAVPSIPVFYADHPFVFIIQEKETGNMLFLGRVTDPSV